MMLRRRASLRLALLGALAGALALSGCANLGDIAKQKCEGDSAADYSDCVQIKFDREQRDLEHMLDWRAYGP
jgi:hypothetical protein